MRLLLDECVPRPLKRDLAAHDVHHVVDMGWSSKRNGELLQLMAAARFEALLTVDHSIEYQQNIGSSGIGVVIVGVRRNRLKELRPLIRKYSRLWPILRPATSLRFAASKPSTLDQYRRWLPRRHEEDLINLRAFVASWLIRWSRFIVDAPLDRAASKSRSASWRHDGRHVDARAGARTALGDNAIVARLKPSRYVQNLVTPG